VQFVVVVVVGLEGDDLLQPVAISKMTKAGNQVLSMWFGKGIMVRFNGERYPCPVKIGLKRKETNHK
jgi:hypothetical protein